MNSFPTEHLNDLLAGTYEPEPVELGKTMAQTLLNLNERIESMDNKLKIQAEIIVVSLKKITLSPGDVLHVKSPRKLGNEMLEHIRKFIKQFFPNNNLIVSDANAEIDMSVIHPEEPGNPEKGDTNNEVSKET